MSESPKFVFGTSTNQQIAKRIQNHVSGNFANASKAAKSLGISRQRLFSYTSGKTLPRAPMFDRFLDKWKLDLLGDGSRAKSSGRERAHVADSSNFKQRSLFDSPITLRSDELKVVIKRKGPRLVASIEIYTDVEIA
jgi:hypothetical protein